MVVVGADVHKRTHTFVAVDAVGKAYYRKRIDAGDSKTEALCCLKRRLARVVFHHLHTDHQNRIQPRQPAAA